MSFTFSQTGAEMSPLAIVASAEQALQETYAATGIQRELEHPREVDRLFAAYLPDMHHDGVASAVLLHDLADRSLRDDPSTEPHARAMYGFLLRQLASESSTSKVYDSANYDTYGRLTLRYVMALLADQPIIEKQENTYQSLPQPPEVLEVVTAGRGANVPVMPTAWTWSHIGMLAPASINDLLEEINVESGIFKSVEALHHLHQPAPTEKAVLQSLYVSGYLYYPLLETTGLHVLATALRGKALEVKLDRLGRNDLLHRGGELIQEADAVFEALVDRLYPGAQAHKLPGDPEIYNSMGHIDGYTKDSIVALPWRRKSHGSTADKLLKYEQKYGAGAVPNDVLALTVVTETWTDAVRELRRIMTLVSEDRANEFALGTSPGSPAKESVFCAGAEQDDHTSELLQSFSEREREMIGVRQKQGSEGYAAYKLLIEFKGQPVEIQFASHEAYKNNDIGVGAHVLYKTGVAERAEAVEHLRKIRERVGYIALNRFNIVNARSVIRGAAMQDFMLGRGARLKQGAV